MIISFRIVRHTQNYDAMRSFYQDLLDMRPVAQWDRGKDDRGTLFVFNGPTSATSIEVITHNTSPEGPCISESPPCPVAVAVEVDNVGALLETLVGRGVEVTREIANMSWGHRSFSVRDPDGLDISFFQDMDPNED